MADYDPKRRRPRAPVPSDEPAAVDALLDAAAHAAAPQPDPDITGEPAASPVPSKVAPSWDEASWADGDRPLSPMVTGGTADRPVESGTGRSASDDWADPEPAATGAARRAVTLVAVVAGVLVVVALLMRRRRRH
jgi:hypothetical protein